MTTLFLKTTLNLCAIFGILLYKVSGNQNDITSLDDLGRGFGNHIYWLTLDNGLQIAQNDDKPLMLLIHKTWCGACKALKPQFAASEEIEKLSKHFVMVNTQDDEEPKGSMFAPDGGYIPRILFLDPNGVVMDEYYNEEGNPDYKYFYSDSKSVVSSMKRVLLRPTKHSKVTDEL